MALRCLENDQVSIEFLRQLPLFSGMNEHDLNWLLENSEEKRVAAGEVLMEEGSPGDALYIVLEGEFEFTKRSGQQQVTLAMRGAGEMIGEMSLLDQAPRTATARATRASRLVMIHQDAFRQLLSTSPAATLAILHTVTSRLRNTEAMLRQNEKMAALGTLSAGLAHELNNPAAAARRSAAQLRDTLAHWQRLNGELAALGLDARQMDNINALHEEIIRRAAAPAKLDPLTRSDREGEMQMWLEDRGIDNAWEIAPPLVAFGWMVHDLDELGHTFTPEQLRPLACWLGVGCSVFALLDEVGQSAERISEIVKSVKSYSYLDQAPIQQVDIHDGLENTLVILRHKLKQGIQVTREYANDLPTIEAYASELNQVWTNIIDNAIDAMKGAGVLTVRTYREDHHVVVEIGDNGPGIPPEIQPRIFEPFFTTKPPGVGTGLGLHISYNIIQKHHGKIQVQSQPGATVFQVSLPIRLKG
ncbi:MAG: cyclic nucleotide-binding domain-containing protein [Chloroflexi bacterium]|nr:cyclic nucleotide-binding domain-containing protein [Chloroflexota bacterium]